MPIYEYTCPECDCLFEEFQSGFEEKCAPCPKCGAESKRIISNTTFVLKGSGWYVTDYSAKKPSANGTNHSAPTESGNNGAGKDTAGKTESKDSSGTKSADSGGSSTASASTSSTD